MNFFNKLKIMCFPLCLSSITLFANIDVDPLITKRWSGYSFDANKTISENQINLLKEAASLAPSCYNDQPWRFIICNRTTNAEAYSLAIDSLVEFNKNWVKNVPLLIIAVSSSHFAKNGNPNRWSQYDTGAASMNLVLQASAMNLMAHQMAGFDEKVIIKNFNIPEGFTPMAIIAIGHPDTLKNEVKPRVRNPLDQNFFDGKWLNNN